MEYASEFTEDRKGARDHRSAPEFGCSHSHARSRVPFARTSARADFGERACAEGRVGYTAVGAATCAGLDDDAADLFSKHGVVSDGLAAGSPNDGGRCLSPHHSIRFV